MEKYYVGWDVGAWHCDKNTNSKDAIAVLNEEGEEVVETKRKVVRCELNENSIFSFLNKYFGCDKFTARDNFIFAIDAVFRLPIGVQEIPIHSAPEDYKSNPFLFRLTEQFVKEKTGNQCRSMIQDKIGSQATKIMFFLKHFSFKQKEIGVWKTDDNKATAIEVYPKLAPNYDPNQKSDKYDAVKCCEIAEKFANERNAFFAPEDCLKIMRDTIKKEGWIWFLKQTD